MPQDYRRDKLVWRNRKANHGIKPHSGRRSTLRFKNRAKKAR